MAEPPGGPPTPPGGGAPDWGEMKGKLTATQGPDRLLLITGAVFFICTFLPWYRVSFSSPGIKASDSSSAWGLDSLGVLAALLGTAALVVAAGAVIGMITLGFDRHAGPRLRGRDAPFHAPSSSDQTGRRRSAPRHRCPQGHARDRSLDRLGRGDRDGVRGLAEVLRRQSLETRCYRYCPGGPSWACSGGATIPGGRPRRRISINWACAASCCVAIAAWIPWNSPSSHPSS